MNKKQGFTLLELLIVIAIIAIIVAFATTNFLGARQRARDIRKKTDLAQLKTALRMYFNDFAVYPDSSGDSVTNTLSGCGTATPPNEDCQDVCSGQFAVGGTGCANPYMKLLPPKEDFVWEYQQVASGDDFCLWTDLENKSDPELSKSQTRCSNVCTGVAPDTSYVSCAD